MTNLITDIKSEVKLENYLEFLVANPLILINKHKKHVGLNEHFIQGIESLTGDLSYIDAYKHFINGKLDDDFWSEFYLFICYYLGVGCPKDVQKALFYLDKSYNIGFIYSIEIMAFCLDNGIEMYQNKSESLRLHQIMLKHGHKITLKISNRKAIIKYSETILNYIVTNLKRRLKILIWISIFFTVSFGLGNLIFGEELIDAFEIVGNFILRLGEFWFMVIFMSVVILIYVLIEIRKKRSWKEK